MSCDACGGELVTTPLESRRLEGSRYGGISWDKITIPRPEDLEEKFFKMRNFYDKTFGYDGSRHADAYESDMDNNLLPEQGTEIEPILEMAGKRPVINVMACIGCGSIQSLQSNLHDIYNAINIVHNWIEGEKEAMLAKEKAKQKKIRDKKRKNYEKQIAALQKKLDKLKDD